MAQFPPMFDLLAELFEKATTEENVDFRIKNWRYKLTAAIVESGVREALQTVVAILPQLQPQEFAAATRLLADGTRYGELNMPDSDNTAWRLADAGKNHGGSLSAKMESWDFTWTVWLLEPRSQHGLQTLYG